MQDSQDPSKMDSQTRDPCLANLHDHQAESLVLNKCHKKEEAKGGRHAKAEINQEEEKESFKD